MCITPHMPGSIWDVTIRDLEQGPPLRRQSARAAVRGGGLDWWLDLLALGEHQRRRVEQLLDELAH